MQSESLLSNKLEFKVVDAGMEVLNVTWPTLPNGNTDFDKINLGEFKDFIKTRTNEGFRKGFSFSKKVIDASLDLNNREVKNIIDNDMLTPGVATDKLRPGKTIINYLPVCGTVLLMCDIYISAIDLVSCSKAEEIVSKGRAFRRFGLPSVIFKVVAYARNVQNIEIGDIVDIKNDNGITNRSFLAGSDNIEAILSKFKMMNPHMLSAQAGIRGKSNSIAGLDVSNASSINDNNQPTDIIRIQTILSTDDYNISGVIKFLF